MRLKLNITRVVVGVESETTVQERSCNLLIGDSSGWVSSKEDLINITKVTSVIRTSAARPGRRTVLVVGAVHRKCGCREPCQ